MVAKLDDTTRALLALAVGTVMLLVMFLALDHIAEWGRDYGRLTVYGLFFLWASIAGRAFWAGADALLGLMRGARE